MLLVNNNCNFSFEHYKKVLSSARDNLGYDILTCMPQEVNISKKYIMLRHDVDFSLFYAEKMSIVEWSENISSTYFLHMNSEFYNVLNKDSMDHIHKILENGHEVGLHYDIRFIPITEYAYHDIEFVVRQVRLLEELFDTKIRAICLHAGSEHGQVNWPITNGEMFERYGFTDVSMQDGQQKYLSESGQYWREGCMCQKINKFDKLLILTHPIWWSDHPHSRNSHIIHLLEHMNRKNYLAIQSYRDMVSRFMKQLNAPPEMIDF